MRVRLKHVKRVSKHLADGPPGTYYCDRRTGLRIEGKPGSPEFLENYEKAARPPRGLDDGTLDGLIIRYRSTRKFQKLSPRTRVDYEKQLSKIENAFGNAPLGALNDRRIRSDIMKWRDQLAQRSDRQADYAVAVLRIVLNLGVEIGALLTNNAVGIENLYQSDRAENIWLPDQVARFASFASTEIQLALLMALHTGQRQGDLLSLTWSAYDGKAITLRQSKSRRDGKGGRRVYIPCTSALKTTLDNLPKRALTILSNSRGRAWTQDGFRTSWWKTSRKAGIVDLTFHDLRGTAVTMLSEAGCTPQEIAAITGHTLRQANTILDNYLARTRPLAEAAIIKFENAAATNMTTDVTTVPTVARR